MMAGGGSVSAELHWGYLVRIATRFLLFCLLSYAFIGVSSVGAVAQVAGTQAKIAASGDIRKTLPSTGVYDPSLDAKVETLLRKMTLEEKVGQLVQYSAGQPTGPGTNRTDYNDMVAKGQIGALFNISTAKEVNAYQRIAVQKSRLHIPILFGLDVIHGFRTEFPIPLGLASTWNPAIVEQASRVAAREASASGVRWTFSPMVDIARDPRWGRMSEGAGEDPFLGSVMAAAYVRGYQGERAHSSGPGGNRRRARHRAVDRSPRRQFFI